jgi:two-component system, NtrC family, sensor histidine kinase HydH
MRAPDGYSLCHTGVLGLWPTGLNRSSIVRPQDFVWILLFAGLAIYGPDRQPLNIGILLVLCLSQILEPKIGFFSSHAGSATSFAIKLVLCYLLIGWSDGVSSPYYWLFLFPVISAATSFGFMGTLISILLVCATYTSFLLFLGPDQYIPIEERRVFFLQLSIFPVVGFLTHQLAESSRVEARRYQAVAEQLAEANRNLKEAEATARRSERLAALGQLSAGLAHELRNPLGTMKASAEMLVRSVDSSNDVAREMAQFISTEVDRTDSLITRFLDFARPLAVRLEVADLSQVLDRAVEEIERHQPPLGIAIYKNYSPDIRPFLLDPELMIRVFYNLLLNAAQASPPKGTVTLKTREVGGLVEVSVIDCGSGIDKKHLENIFNPFFTTKAKGVGLGLAIVSKVVDEHGGKIAVESEAGSGSVFRVYLPYAQAPAAREVA